MVSSKVDEENMEVMKKISLMFFSGKKRSTVVNRRVKSGRIKLGRNGSMWNGDSKVTPKDQPAAVSSDKGILDPEGGLVLIWTRFFIFTCLVSLFIDPLFFFLPTVVFDSTNKISCTQLDQGLSKIITILRTVSDFFYVVNILVKFRTAYIAPRSRVFGRGELVIDGKEIERRYFKSNFFLDLVAALPLPQIVLWIIIPAFKNPDAYPIQASMCLFLFCQYFLRMYFIFILGSQMIEATGVVTKTGLAGATYNVMLYMLGCHITGSAWYLMMYNTQIRCWEEASHAENASTQFPNFSSRFFSCDFMNVDVDQQRWANSTKAFANCDAAGKDGSFDFGIFTIPLIRRSLSESFARKYVYCLWWGLQNLSSYGQNLITSTYIGETAYASLIAVMGLVMMAHLIGRVETYMQSTKMRLEQWRLKRRDTELWIEHRRLPCDLQDRVLKFLHYKWLATRGVDEEAVLRSLPPDLRHDIRRYLCLHLVQQVPLFAQLDDQLLDAICERLVSSLCIEGTCVVQEGNPVTKMLFIIRGRLESFTSGNGGTTDFSNYIILRPGDFCGVELLSWALLPTFANLPSSTRTVKALTDVEAFALRAEDLRFVAKQFRRMHSKTLQHAFRFYSHQWRNWAACLLQVTWRRYRKRLTVKYMSKHKSFSSTASNEQITEAGET